MMLRRLLEQECKILLPKLERFELLYALTHPLLNHQRVREIDAELRAMSSHVEVKYAEPRFWDEVLPDNLSRFFLKSRGFIIASCALHWKVDEFYSFDEKLNRALRRIKPELVQVKIKKGKIILEAKPR